MIDSIQTLYTSELSAAPGSVSQVRECASQLTRLAKALGITTILVGHVTKDGSIIWPDRQLILFAQEWITRRPRLWRIGRLTFLASTFLILGMGLVGAAAQMLLTTSLRFGSAADITTFASNSSPFSSATPQARPPRTITLPTAAPVRTDRLGLPAKGSIKARAADQRSPLYWVTW